MKLPLSALKAHLDTDAEADAIAAALVDLGHDVAEVEDPRTTLRAFTLGHVVAAERHPDADKLKICRVATDTGEQQIICGAPNARDGIIVVVAKPGTYVPGIDTTIQVGKIRGIESHGMMCSEREMQLSDEHDGIIELPSGEVGQSFVDWLAQHRPERLEPVLTLDADAGEHAVERLARDLAARGLGTLVGQGKAPNLGKVAIPFDADRLAQVTGLTCAEGEQRRILETLGFAVDGATVTPPVWREDIRDAADLTAELVRVLSVATVPSAALPRLREGISRPVIGAEQRRLTAARRTAASLGYAECLVGGPDESPFQALLGAIAENQRLGMTDIALFCVSRGEGGLQMSGMIGGHAAPSGPHDTPRAVDVFDAKAHAEAVLSALAAPERAQIRRDGGAEWHPGRHGQICLGPKKVLATFGEIHPKALKSAGIEGPIAAFSIWPGEVPLPKSPRIARPPLAGLGTPAVERLMQFRSDPETAALDLVNAALGADKAAIESVRVVADRTEEGARDITLLVTMRPGDATFDDAALEDKIVQKVVKGTGAAHMAG